MGMITIGIGDARVSKDTDDVLVTHALGSCIAVAIHDPSAGVAGLLHILLPNSKSSPDKSATHPCMFADTGIPALFHSAYALGAQKSRLTVRMLGGAQVLDPQGVFNIGKQNYLACRRILWAAGVLIAAEEVGGTISRTVRLTVNGGRLEWNTGGGPSRELPVKGRPGPAAAQETAPTPVVCSQLDVCRQYLQMGGAALNSPDVPLGARAHAPWCANCALRKGGR
jgi:chemotaxis protein CheD